MKDAPRDTPIQLFLPEGKTAVAEYYDCSWLREGPNGEDVWDCWRVVGEKFGEDPAANDIELREPLGWLPLDPDLLKDYES
ncbi:hypothetical protein [Roseibium sp.]|uniref:hypothetical protein n=1 Tax=Roseibium sp. TaxID=1936156 RepID=UPI003B52A586